MKWSIAISTVALVFGGLSWQESNEANNLAVEANALATTAAMDSKAALEEAKRAGRAARQPIVRFEHTVSQGNSDTPARIHVQATNHGSGAAIVHVWRVFVGEVQVRSWQEALMRSGCLGDTKPKAEFRLGGFSLGGGEEQLQLDAEGSCATQAFYRAYYSGILAVETCYCSLADECWFNRFARNDNENAREVKDCSEWEG